MIEHEERSGSALDDLDDDLDGVGAWGSAPTMPSQMSSWRISPGEAPEPDLSLSGQAPPPGVWAGIESMLRAEGLIHED